MNSQDIDKLLKASAHEPALPTSFRSELWTRIAYAEQRSFGAKLSRVLAFFTRPAPAVASVIATVLIGVSLGFATTQPTKDARISYAESISPFLQEKAP